MKRPVLTGLTLAALLAAGAGGYVAGHRGFRIPAFIAPEPHQVAQGPAPDGPVIYYRDPDGKPSYSATATMTADGRAFRPVLASEDISFEPRVVTESVTSNAGPRKIRFYRNPMGLPDTSPVPKKDGMGMDYIPVYEGEDADDGSVRLSAGKMQRTGVKSEAAAMRVVHVPIRAPGTIQLDERRITVIALRAEAWVQKIENVTTGTIVRQGQPLMQVYSPAIAAAAADFVAALGTTGEGTTAGKANQGSRQRLHNLDVPEVVIAIMEKTRAVPLSMPWVAPRGGVVIERNAIEGMRVQPGDVLFKLADTSVVWAMADIAERQFATLAVGQPVAVRARGRAEKTYAGKVNVIYPQINRETRTVKVRIELNNPDLALLPEMYVDAEIDTGNALPVLTVPESAVIDTGRRQIVLVDKDEGRFEPRDVTTGLRGNGFVEIREGLAEGQSVVVSANFLIDAESNLKAALRTFSDAGATR